MVFEKESFEKKLNETLITLITKEQQLERISHLYPIALCNVVVKGITNIVTNLLKVLMQKLAGERQSVLCLEDRELIMLYCAGGHS